LVGRRGKFWDGSKPLVVTLFVTKKNIRKKKKAMACLCRHLLRFKQKQKNERRRRRRKKKAIEEKKMQRRKRVYLSSLAFAFGMKYSSCLLLFTFLQC
jgi:hypothetical protein